MAISVPIAVAVVGAGATVYQTQQANKAAKDARRPAEIAEPEMPKASNTADDLAKANMLAQTAGGSLLSDPAENRRTGRQIGSAVKPGASLLGS